ncbi:substrate-binding domain-containing protein [Streptomyces populi]
MSRPSSATSRAVPDTMANNSIIKEARSSALLIGCGIVDDVNVQNLAAPSRDVERLAEVLTANDYAVETLIDCTEREAREAVCKLLSGTRAGDTCLLYLSCHGMPDESSDQLYFALRDTSLSQLGATGLSASWLRQQIESSTAGVVVVVLDCCYSGAFVGERKADIAAMLDPHMRGLVKGLMGKGGPDAPTAQPRGFATARAVLTSSSQTEQSYENIETRLSYFTEIVIDGLRGAAAREGKDAITVTQLQDYVTLEFPRRYAMQSPRVYFNGTSVTIARKSAWQASPEATCGDDSDPVEADVPSADPGDRGAGTLGPGVSATPGQVPGGLHQGASSALAAAASDSRSRLVDPSSPGAGQAEGEPPKGKDEPPKGKDDPLKGKDGSSMGFMGGRGKAVPIALVPTAALAVVGALLWWLLPGSLIPGSPHTSPSAASPGSVKSSGPPRKCTRPTEQLNLAVSPDFSQQMRLAAEAYGPHADRSRGTCVEVVVQDKNSGEATRALARGWKASDGATPDVWSPAASVWLPLARAQATKTAKDRLPSTEPQAIVTSPLTIAMPELMAKELGWPEKKINWNDLADWAAHAQGFWTHRQWTHTPHPEWGDFKLGKTNPAWSTSGLHATLAAFFADTGTSAQLTPESVADQGHQKIERNIEKAVVHYGDTTLAFLANLRHADTASEALSYISAVTVEEQAVVAYNQGYPCGALRSDTPDCGKTTPPHTRLVSFYPEDGVLYSDHPYIKLGGMNEAKRSVADNFLTYLHSSAVQRTFAEVGYRDWRGRSDPQNGLVTQDNGALPDKKLHRMQLPTAATLAKLLEVWPDLRRRANVMLVVDTSSAMGTPAHGKSGPSRLQSLQQAQDRLFTKTGFGSKDDVGMWRIADPTPLVPLGPMDENLTGSSRRDILGRTLGVLRPGGDTGPQLFDTVDNAVRGLRARNDPKAINAVVVLADGSKDLKGGAVEQQLIHSLSDPEQPRVRVFTVAYGSPEKGDTPLKEIAEASGGRAYRADDPRNSKNSSTTLNTVLTNVISNF